MRATQRAAIQSLALDDIGYYHLCLRVLSLPKAAPWHIMLFLLQWYGVDTRYKLQIAVFFSMSQKFLEIWA